MLSKNDIKFIHSLSQKKFREETGLFIVEGDKIVSEAIDSGFKVERVLYMDEIGEESMSRISLLSSPSPALAVLFQKKKTAIEFSKDGLYIALDSVRDPGNLGTILRIADWFGIDGIIASEDTVELYNPKVVQASMGAIFRTNVQYVDLYSILKELRESIPLYGTFLQAPDIYKERLSNNGIIVMGSESNGISSNISDLITNRLFIPDFSKSDSRGSESLNVAIATAIVCSEFRRSSV
ncbi:MAG: RNA methyltransferase [Rikenellaceae bacterium]|nr:RNA methyltransferase [Rikenellaceae bacterium]